MNRLLSFIAVGLIALSVAPAANAQYGMNMNIDATQAQLQQRINVGFNSGRLTRSEFTSLQNKLNRINSIESRMRSSGFRFSMSERNKLSYELTELNRDITRQLNDADTRFSNRGGRYNNNNWNRNWNRHHGWHHQ